MIGMLESESNRLRFARRYVEEVVRGRFRPGSCGIHSTRLSVHNKLMEGVLNERASIRRSPKPVRVALFSVKSRLGAVSQ